MGDNAGRERAVLKCGVEVGEAKVEEEAKVDPRAEIGRYDTCV